MHRVILQAGPFTLYAFGLMVILGFMAGAILAARLARARGLPGDAFLDGAVIMLFSGVAGARLLFVLLNWKSFGPDLLKVGAIWQGGMSFHGGVAAGILGGVLYFRRRKLPILAMLDAGAPGIALAYAVGRIGCLLNGCCYGSATHLPWALPGAYCLDADPALTYHPTQVYAALLNLALCGGLAWAYHRPHRTGQILALYVGGYSVYRFLIESLRKGVTAEVWVVGLTGAQVFSLAAIAAAVLGWVWLQRRSAAAQPLRRAEDFEPDPAGQTQPR